MFIPCPEVDKTHPCITMWKEDKSPFQRYIAHKRSLQAEVSGFNVTGKIIVEVGVFTLPWYDADGIRILLPSGSVKPYKIQKYMGKDCVGINEGCIQSNDRIYIYKAVINLALMGGSYTWVMIGRILGVLDCRVYLGVGWNATWW